MHSPNQPPIATLDSDTTTENATFTLDVLANDTDPDDSPAALTVDTFNNVVVTGGVTTGGTVSIVGNQIEFEPGTDFDALDDGDTATVTFDYTMSDDDGATSTASVVITVTGENDAPVANDDTAAGTENEALTIDALANDTDVDGDDAPANFVLNAAILEDVVGVADGITGSSVSIDANRIEFIPGPGFNELDTLDTATATISYVMSDASGATSTGTVTVTITGTNDTPLALTDSGSGTENQVVTIDVLANDLDQDESDTPANFSLDTVAIQSVTGELLTGGTVSVVGNQLEFDPGTDFDALDTDEVSTVTIDYVMSDDEDAASSSTATVTVTGVNDAPVAVLDTASASDNQTITIDVLANDTDVDGEDNPTNFSLNAITDVAVSGALTTGGTASIVGNQIEFDTGTDFQSLAEGETATVVITYQMSDNEGATSTSTVTITVNGTNNNPPVAVDDSATSTENETVTVDVLANDTDLDAGDDPTNFTLVSGNVVSASGLTVSLAGSVDVVGNQLEFTPETGFDELDSGDSSIVEIAYTVADDEGATDTGTLLLTVLGANDAPVAAVDSVSGSKNEVLTIDVLANDTDVDAGDTSANFSIDDATITDVSGAVTTGGLVNIVGNQLEFDPNGDFDALGITDTATVTISYEMSDDEGVTSTSTVTITLNSGNVAPTAVPDTVSSTENEVLVVLPLANDTDPDIGDEPATFSLDDVSIDSVTGLSGTTGGSVSLFTSDSFRFFPGANFNELDAGDIATVIVDYIMSDDDGATSASTVTITVNGVNDAPVTFADNGAGTENETLSLDVLANDTDVDLDDGPATFSLDSVAITNVSGAVTSGGSVDIVANQLEFEPGTDFDVLNTGETATITVSYTMSDTGGIERSNVATIVVTGTNDTPVAFADSDNGTDNQTLTIDVLSNDTDADAGDNAANFVLVDATIDEVTGAVTSGGEVSIVGNQLRFDPGTDFQGMAFGDSATVTISYTMEDDEGATSTSTVTITVTGTDNTAPVANTDTGSGTENEVLTLDVLANDTDADPGDDPTTFVIETASAIEDGNASVVANQIEFDPGTDFDALDAGETTTVTINYTMADDEGATSTSTATLTLTGVNDAPSLDVNTGTVVRAGGTRVLTDTLQTSDPDNDPTEIVYTVASGPFIGQLELLSNPGVAITSFTQAQLTEGDVIYIEQSATTGTDTFNFTVSDGTATSSNQVYSITIANAALWDNESNNGSWHTAQNWSDDQLPGSDDFVVINDQPGTVSYTTGTTEITSLDLIDETLTISGGTLSLQDFSTVGSAAQLNVDAFGTLQTEGRLEIEGNLDIQGGTVSGGVAGGVLQFDDPAQVTISNYSTFDAIFDNVEVQGDLALTNSIAVQFRNGAKVLASDGVSPGTINFVRSNFGTAAVEWLDADTVDDLTINLASVYPSDIKFTGAAGETLIFESGVTVQNGAGRLGGFTEGANVDFRGTLTNAAGTTDLVSLIAWNGSFLQGGSVSASGGNDITVSSFFGGTTVDFQNSGTMSVDGTGSVLTLADTSTVQNDAGGSITATNDARITIAGDLTNATGSTFTVTGATLGLTGTVSNDPGATIELINGAELELNTTLDLASLLSEFTFTGAGNVVQVAGPNGDLDLEGATFDVDTLNATLDLSGGTVSGGVAGGVLQFDDPAQVTISNYSTFDAIFDNVEVQGDLALTNSIAVQFRNGAKVLASDGVSPGTINFVRSNFGTAAVEWLDADTVDDLTINLASVYPSDIKFTGAAGETLIFESGVTVQNGAGRLGGFTEGANVDFRGTLTNAAGTTDLVSLIAWNGSFLQGGSVSASGGNDITVSSFFGGTTVDFQNSGTMSVDGTGSVLTLADTSTVQNDAGGSITATNDARITIAGDLTNATGSTFTVTGATLSIANSGTLDNSAAGTLSLDTVVFEADGTFVGDLSLQDVDMTFAVGNAITTFVHDGDVVVGNGTEIEFNFNNTAGAIDLYDISGSATFNSGVLIFEKGGFDVSAGDSFVFLEAGSVSLANADVAFAVTGVSSGTDWTLDFTNIDGDADIEGVLTANATASNGSQTLFYGSSGDDVFNSALFGPDILDGKAGDDDISGGTGADRIIGGVGNDTLTGGNGVAADFASDVFVFDVNEGDDVITDFENGRDLIDVSALGVADTSGFTISDVGADKVIDFNNGTTVTLSGLDGVLIDDADFIFV
ncbi:MAG: Ig-like domain-containing protein [Pseudomonadota bacterium]